MFLLSLETSGSVSFYPKSVIKYYIYRPNDRLGFIQSMSWTKKINSLSIVSLSYNPNECLPLPTFFLNPLASCMVASQPTGISTVMVSAEQYTETLP